MDIDARRAVGARIREARHRAGLTQHELAELLDVTTRTIQNYESGVAVPYKHLRSIEALGRKRPGWVLEGGESLDLVSTIADLQSAMERHQELMQSHLQVMYQHTQRLRDQVRAGAERRARTTD